MLFRSRLDSAFDIRAFHDAMLGGGAVSLGTMRELVERRLGLAGDG